jgi:hypothetical protein
LSDPGLEVAPGRHQGVGECRRGFRPDTGKQPEGPEGGHPIERVLGEPEDRHEVLDVSGLDELQPTVLHERHVTPAELDLEHRRVVGRAEEHRLAGERDALLTTLQDRSTTQDACSCSSVQVTRTAASHRRAGGV